jgi:hypothetical protein
VFYVVHDQSGFTAPAMADRVATPVVHPLHGGFVEATGPLHQRHGHRARLAAISRSQVASAPRCVEVIHVVSGSGGMVPCGWRVGVGSRCLGGVGGFAVGVPVGDGALVIHPVARGGPECRAGLGVSIKGSAVRG